MGVNFSPKILLTFSGLYGVISQQIELFQGRLVLGRGAGSYIENRRGLHAQKFCEPLLWSLRYWQCREIKHRHFYIWFTQFLLFLGLWNAEWKGRICSSDGQL
jgi:hypothetical protein